MAYTYNPNAWAIYDDSVGFDENVKRGAVITKEKMERLEEAAKMASAEIAIGTVTISDDVEHASADMYFNKDTGTRVLNLTIPRGLTGATGPAGEQGPQGEVGPAGETGPAGEQGETGKTVEVTVCEDVISCGCEETAKVEDISETDDKVELQFTIPKGEKGEPGEQGPAGEKGDAGEAATIEVDVEVETVEAGESAKVENTGDQTHARLKFTIPKGEQGPAGPQGEQGEAGPQGPAGETGPEGPRGETGHAAKIKIGTVKTGDEAKVENAGDDDDLVLNITLPKGDKGDRGEQGPAGRDGEAGPQGPAGVDGVNGKNGERGPKGERGDRGPGFYYTVEKPDSNKQIAAYSIKPEGIEVGDFIVNRCGCVYQVNAVDKDGDGKVTVAESPLCNITGPAGVDGKDGAVGPQGPRGEQGIQGVPGPKGDRGEDGTNGEDGAEGKAATVVIGTVKTGPEAKVENAGTANAAILNITLPEGKEGPAGPTGPTGPAGETGPQGPAGNNGQPGERGADGQNATITVTEKVTHEGEGEPTLKAEGSGTSNVTITLNMPQANILIAESDVSSIENETLKQLIQGLQQIGIITVAAKPSLPF